MSDLVKLLTGAAGLAAVVGFASPAAAQYYPGYGYNNGGGVVGAIINGVLGGRQYGNQSVRQLWRQRPLCRRPVQPRGRGASRRRLSAMATATTGYTGGGRVVGITGVERSNIGPSRPRRRHVGQLRRLWLQQWRAANLSFSCKVDYRGRIIDLDLDRRTMATTIITAATKPDGWLKDAPGPKAPAHFSVSARLRATSAICSATGAPAAFEPHLAMLVAVGGILVDRGRGVAGAAVAGVVEAVDRGEGKALAAVGGKVARREAGKQGAGPHDALFGHDLEDAGLALELEILALHQRVEAAARAQVDLAFGGLIGPRAPPLLDQFGVGPGAPQLRRAWRRASVRSSVHIRPCASPLALLSDAP